MTLSNYEKALELTAKKKAKKDTMALLEINYLKLLLPVASAILIIDALKEARVVKDLYSIPKIGGVSQDDFNLKLLSEEDATDIEVASMLGITTEEAITSRTAFNKRRFENE